MKHRAQPSRRYPRSANVLLAGLLAGTVGATLTVISIDTPVAVADGDPTSASTCTQPQAQGKDDWGLIRGGELRRDESGGGVVVHQVNTIKNPSIYLPQQVVQAGQTWEFSYSQLVDSIAAAGVHHARIEVDWYSTPNGNNKGYLGHVNGPWVEVPTHITDGSRIITGRFKAPAGAVRANVIAELSAITSPSAWALSACGYRLLSGPPTSTAAPSTSTTTAPPSTTTTAPTSTSTAPTTTTAPPTTTTTVTPPPAGDGVTAAATFNWGTPIPQASDEFNYTGPPDPAKWSLYNGPGHDGNGRRVAALNTVQDGFLRQTGEADGDAAGMASRFNQRYGRWEARVRSVGTGEGNKYHPLLIVWPESNRWPDHGEYDFLENGAPGEVCAEAFLHYPGHTPKRQEHAVETGCGAPLSEWHNVAFEWTPERLKGFIDGKEWFSFGEADMTEMPSGHLTIQLDNFYGLGMQPATYDVAWVRTYRL